LIGFDFAVLTNNISKKDFEKDVRSEKGLLKPLKKFVEKNKEADK